MFFRLLLVSLVIVLNSYTVKADFLGDLGKGLAIINEIDKFVKRNGKQGSRKSSRKTSVRKQQSINQWKKIQARLNELGYDAGKVDGRPGRKTKIAIQKFQSANGLKADGKVGSKTRAALLSNNAIAYNGNQVININGLQSAGFSPGAAQGQVQNESRKLLVGKLLKVKNIPGSIFGEWEGIAECAAGVPYYISLSIWKNDSVRLQARMTYTLANVLSDGNWTNFSLIGEAVSENKFEFFTESQFHGVSSRLSEIKKPNFIIDFKAGAEHIQGQYSNGNCSSFSISKVSPTSVSRMVFDGAKYGVGTFWQTSGLFERCGVFRNWWQSLATEYQGLEDLYSKSDLLMTDEQFIPIFGVPVDGLNLSQIREVRNASYACFRDPIWQVRLAKYKKIENGFSSWIFNEKRKSKKFEFMSQADIWTWKVRRIRNQIKLEMNEINDLSRSQDISSGVSAVRTKVSQRQDFFLPSELSEFNEFYANQMSRVYSMQADMEIASLKQIKDPVNVFLKLKEFLGKQEFYSNNLLAEEFENYQNNLEIAQQRAAKGLRQLIIFDDDLQDSTIEKLKAFEARVAKFDTTLKIIAPKSLEEQIFAINNHRDAILSNLIVSRSEDLDKLKSDADGAQQSVEWRTDFNADFEAYLDNQQVAKLVKRYESHRSKLLSGALAKFTEAFKQVVLEDRQDGADKILKLYLSAPNDIKLPIAKDYYSFAARYEVDQLNSNPSAMNLIIGSKEMLVKLASYSSVLPQEELASLTQQVGNIHEQAAEKILGRFFNEQKIETLEDLHKFDKRMMKSERIVDLLLNNVAAGYRQKAMQIKQMALEIIVQIELKKLIDYPPTVEGLKDSAGWLPTVSEKFKNYDEIVELADLQKKYMAHRQQLLGRALGNFEKDIEKAAENDDAEAIKNILNSYLSWVGDEEFPVALEYQFIAEVNL